MKNKYPLGTIFLREINGDYGVVIRVKEKKTATIYSVSWSKRNEYGVVFDYTEDELGRWYKKV